MTNGKSKNYRTLDQIQEEYYGKHPEEIDSFLETAVEEYAKDGVVCGKGQKLGCF